ncbi:MAG: DUF4340 domain-containing protein [Verrucomicrobiales bacterium]|nr:DUF4340 domain-containing protein [Verrucomicrobiales bacterium]
MRVKTTAVLGVVAIILAIVTASLDRRSTAGRGAASAANVLLRFAPESVERIVIEKGTAKTVLEEVNGIWFFSEPEVDRVDSRVIASLLDELNHLNIVDEIDNDEEELNPVQLGVKGDKAIRVSLGGETEDGEVLNETITVGESAPREGSIYTTIEGLDGVKVVDGGLRSWLEKPLEALRDRRILSAPVEAIVQLGIGRSTGEVVFQRRITPPQQDWAIAEPFQAWADREKLDDLLTELASLSIEEVLVQSKSDEPIPNPLPDDAALLQVQVYGIEEPLTVYLKQIEAPEVEGGPALVEARMSDRPGVYRFSSGILGQLPRKANELRDRTLARIPMSYLRSITIESRIDPRVFLRSQTNEDRMSWDVMVNDKFLPANLGQVGELVTGVNEAAILDFASDDSEKLAEFGLMPPAQAIRFDLQFPAPPDQSGNPGQIQDVSRILQLGWREGEENRLFANFKGEPYIYELASTFARLIPTHPIKWRSLNVLTFNQFHLKSITREQPGKEKLKLNYDYRRDDWEAMSSGVDVTDTLDKSAATSLRNRLGSLNASGWFLSLGGAYEALQTPSVSFEIVTTELDAATGDPQEVTRMLHLAPSTTKNVYFGIIENIQGGDKARDVFYIDHETYREFLRPVIASRAAP